MNKTLLKALVLTGVFLLTSLIVSLATSQTRRDSSSEMAKATMPVLSMKSGDKQINILYGYKGEMNPCAMRDTITPLPEDGGKLPVLIQTYGQAVDSLSYAVRSLDNSRLIESTKVTDYAKSGEQIEAELPIKNLLNAEEEYLLIISLECKGDKISYYTRIIQSANAYIQDCLSFAQEFHDRTFDPGNAPWLATYMEPNNEGDNTTLQKVNIHSSTSQVTWQNFPGKQLQAPVASIKEIGSFYNTIVLSYVMSSADASGAMEYYDVEEYFRLNCNSSGGRIYLLDYQRTMNEIYQGDGDTSISSKSILLGIRPFQVDYASNQNGNIVSFVQDGELWAYDSGSNRLSRIFSFRTGEKADVNTTVRENDPNHGIRIIRMDEAGSTDFVVYGYMNRGPREGRSGISVYHFDSMAGTIKELLFLKSDKSYEILKEDWGKLFYVSDNGVFYLIVEDSLYGINWEKGTADKLFRGMSEDNYAVSANGRYLAYREDGSENIVNEIDLESGQKRQITAQEGDILMPIGFLGSDFIYGQAHQGDVTADLFPMYKLTIEDRDGNEVKSYEKPGVYVSAAHVENETIILDRVENSQGYFVQTIGDAIKSPGILGIPSIRVLSDHSDTKQSIVKLETSWNQPKTKPQLIGAKEALTEGDQDIRLEGAYPKECYYAYVAGKVIFSGQELPAVIQTADSGAGVVIDENQSYIWRRGRKQTASVAQGGYFGEAQLSAIREGKALSDGKLLNLRGLSLSQVLYYVNVGVPVYCRLGSGEEQLIIGYDLHNVTIYGLANGQTVKKGLQDGEAYFAGEGNNFSTILP